MKQLIITEPFDIGDNIKPFSWLSFPLPIGLCKDFNELSELTQGSNHPWLSVLQKCDQDFVKLQNVAWNTSDTAKVFVDSLVLNLYLKSVVLQQHLTISDDCKLQKLLKYGYSFNIGGKCFINTPYLTGVDASFKFLRKYMRFKVYK